MAAILKLWRQIENPTPSIDAYLLEQQSYRTKFRPDPIWNDGLLGFSEQLAQQEQEEEEEQNQ